MRNVLVLGSEGNIGQAVQWAFAELDFGVYTYDVKEVSRDNHFTNFDRALQRADPALVFSCLPYTHTQQRGFDCITNKIPYFDLGGNRGVSQRINELAEWMPSQCFTDLGLAPGWVNIKAEKYFTTGLMENYPTRIEMYCGGLPAMEELYKCGPAKYALTWSLAGLWNEYTDKCEVLADGKLVEIPGMSYVREDEYRFIPHGETDKEHMQTLVLEKFPTSGGLAHSGPLMLRRGLQDCNYCTLRYPGHAHLVKEVMESGIANKLNVLAGLMKAYPAVTKDAVYFGVTAEFDESNWCSETYMYEGDEIFTAMQKCTAFPAAAVASLYQQMPNQTLTYRNVPLDNFDTLVDELFRAHERRLEE